MIVITEIIIRNRIYKLTLLIVFLGLTIDVFAQDVQLFNHIDVPQTEWAGKQVADLRQAEIQVHETVLNQIRDGQITEFSIMGFNGIEYTIEVRRIIQQLDGDWSVIGWLNGNWKDPFILSYSNDEVLSTIREVTNHNFMEIRFDSELNNHLLIEIDPHERDELECGQDHELVVPDDETQNLRQENFEPSFNNSTVIDVMVVYTPSAESWASFGSGGIRNVINQAMAIAQNSVDNSRINLVFRLVHTARVNYNETGSTSTDLRNLTFGSISNVHNLRNQYGADLVAMFTRTNDVGGASWLMDIPEGNSVYGYSITRVQQAAWTSTHAHEMGHNLGNHHSRNQIYDRAPASGGVYTYSTGWRWWGTDGRSYASVMTYRENSTMVEIFSNPNISYAGTPTGSYTGAYSPADNARSMELMKSVIAGYRSTSVFTSPPTVSTSAITNISFTSAQGGGNVSNDGGRTVTSRGICWSISQNPGFSDTCRSSGSGTGSFSVSIDNLSIHTTYYVRAYAANAEGTSFGEQRSFTTLEIAVDPGQSTIATNTSKVQANNQNSAEITVIARDFRGMRLSGFSTSLVATQGSLQSSPQTVATNSDGLARFNVTNSKVEQVTYSAVAGGVRLVSTVQVRFMGIDAQRSELTVTEANGLNSARVLANGESQAEIIVIARDEFGDLFSNVRVELSADGVNSVIEEVQRRTDDNGVAIFRVSNEIAERVTYSASALGVTINQTAEISFISLDPNLSSIVASDDKVQANGYNKSEISVTARDQEDQPIGNIVIDLVSSGNSAVIESVNHITDENGIATFRITNTVPETVTLTASGMGTKLSDQVEIRFLGIDAQLSSLEAEDQVVQADGVTAARLIVIAKDEDNVPFRNAEIEISSSSNTTSIQSVQKITDEDGIALFDVTNTVPEKVTYTANGLGTTISQTASINFIPIAPVALAASQVKTRSFNANWELVNGADSYQLDVATDSSFVSLVIGYESVDTGNVTSYEVTTLSAGTDYYYRVRAKVGDLTGAFSETIYTITYPEVPIASAASEQNALQFKANWQVAEGARYYRIDVALDEEFENILQSYNDLEIGNHTNLEINNLQPGTDYNYRVRSQADFRLSDHSNIVNTSTLSISADQSRIEQEQLRILANGAQTNDINVIVKSDNGIVLKDLQVILVPDVWQSTEDYPSTITDENGLAHFVLSSETAGVVNYKVEAHETIIGEFQIEYLVDEGILVLGNNYPNPFQQRTILPVTIPSTMPIEIRVYDILGQPVQTIKNEVVEPGYYEVPFMAYGLASGVYFYRLFADGKILTERMVMVR